MIIEVDSMSLSAALLRSEVEWILGSGRITSCIFRLILAHSALS
jgi:hypothetical protein